MMHTLRLPSWAVTRLLVALILIWTGSGAAQESVLYTFSGGKDGSLPESFHSPALTLDAKGNLFGITPEGGANGWGLVYELSPQPGGGWSQTILYTFTQGADGGGYPVTNLSFDAAGNLYGVAGGGPSGQGVFFELTPKRGGGWTYNVLYNLPLGPEGLTLADADHFFGATPEGGNNGTGTVFELSNSGGTWTYSEIYRFAGGSDGQRPEAGVTIAPNGALYGTTTGGGDLHQCHQGGCGTVYQLTPNPDGSWTHTVIYAFTSGSGAAFGPQVTLLLDSAGNLYGTTIDTGGGKPCGAGCGTVYEISPSHSGTWKETTLYRFKGGADGESPFAPLVMDSSGSLYGTTYGGGANGMGTVFKLTPSGGRWKKTLLNSFAGGLANDGANPLSGLTFDATGNLYGTTALGPGHGSVYELPAPHR